MKVIGDRFKSLPVTGVVLGMVALGILGVAYWSNVQDRERYLQSRNFRLLADLASQVSNLIENRARIFRDTVGDPRVQAAEPWQWLDRATAQMRAAGAENDLAHAVIVSPKGSTTPPSAPELKDYQWAVGSERSSLLVSWVPPPGGQTVLTMRLPVDAALAGVFRAKLGMGAFDTMVLATPNGQVVYAAGRRAAEMQAMSVSAILPVPAGKEHVDLTGLADRIFEERVRIAGVEYRMFAQPCCRNDALDAPVGRSPATGFMVIGLADTEAMRVASLAISPVLVLAGVALVMAALVGWPFLKCALMGAQQRITRRDVISLGTSSLFGLSLATILLLTIGAYARLSADVAAQLQGLALEIHRQFEGEVTRAAKQSRAMTDALRGKPCVSATAVAEARTNRKQGNPCFEITDKWTDRRQQPPIKDGYEDYTGFSLVDPDGFQRVKAAPTAANQRQVLIVEREYFKQSVTGLGLWRVNACPDGCFLESHWSWISGKPQVVLARATGIEPLPVATLAIPMRSVIDPVLPPGFEFAIVDQDGKVQFHSDTQRNVHENLLLETDRNARLQSLLISRGEGSLNTSYWGRPYRAYVKPTVIPGWSIVTLHDKQQTRPLVLEWTATALSMQALYMAGWLAAMLLVLWRGGSWLWPDPLRRPWYGPIAMVCVAGLILWSIVAARSEVITTAIVGMAVPIVVWLVTYLLLATRPPGVGEVRAWSELCRDYRLAGALLLVVSSMVPAAAFFALSYDLHIEAHLKQRQIALAQEVDRKQPCSEGGFQTPSGSTLVRYDKVFYGSSPTCAESPHKEAETTRVWDIIHAKLEELLPYYTSASIALRELMHHESGDGSWSSARPDPSRLEVTVQARQPAYQMTVASPLPAFVGVRALQGEPAAVWVTLIALALLPGVAVVAFGIVSYLLRRVALADVVEPARPNHKVETTVGQHVLLVCDNPAERADRLADAFVLRLTPIATSSNTASAWRRARAAVNEVAPIQRVAIPDIDERPEDVGLLRRKLGLIEELMGEADQTVILVSRTDAAALTERARAASKWDADSERGPKLIARLTVVDQRALDKKDAEQVKPSTPASWWRDLLSSRWRDLQKWWGDLQKAAVGVYTELVKRWHNVGREHNWRQELIASEGRSHPVLDRIHTALRETQAFQDGSLTRDQILEEFEERAVPFYQRIWDACDTDERVVLEHVARHGLASAASRRVVRRLLSRGLLRKDPELRLMNQSFARFVLEVERRLEVAALEQLAEPSLWDRLRVPLAVASVIAVTFLVATQREAFDATLSMAVGVSAAVPTLVKLTTLLTRLGIKADPKANA